MDTSTPQVTVPETSDTLDMASEPVSSMTSQTAAAVSCPPSTLGNGDQVQQTSQAQESTKEQDIQESIETDSGEMANTNDKPQSVITSEARVDCDSDVEMNDHIEEVCPPLKPKEELNMFDKYAFDFEGKAYDHHIPQPLTNNTFLYIGRLHPQTTTLTEHCQVAKGKDEIDICPPLVPHKNELNSETKTWDGRRAIECVWVGMLPGWKTQAKSKATSAVAQTQPKSQCLEASPVDEAQVDGSAEKKVPRKTKTAPRIVDLNPTNMSSTPFDPNALRVVAKRSTKATKVWFLYALLNPDPATKLCQGWRVGFDEVFYFKPFRGDDAAGYMQRKKVTQEKIRSLIFYKEPNDSASLSSSKQSGNLPSTPGTGKFRKQPNSLPSPPSTGKSSKRLSKKPPSEKKTGNAVDADSEFDAMVDMMMRNVNGSEPKVNKGKDASTKRAGAKAKSVSFQEDDLEVSDLGDEDLEAEAKSLASQHDIEHMTTKMMSLVLKMANKKDLAALSQGYTMLKCMEERCTPLTTSALGLYLNVPPGEDGDPRACAVKLRELLDLFPQLEDVDMDSHVLAWVVRGLQLTGQSVDMGLLPAYLASFGALFRARFGDTANHQARLLPDDIVDMTCQARGDAEKMCGEGSTSGKKPGGLDCPSHPYISDVGKIWKAFDWSDPRGDAAAEDDADAMEL